MNPPTANDAAVSATVPPASVAPSMAGTTISHYRILHELGAGGMGVVWKAEDIRLGRHVALKFLPPTSEKDASLRQRLMREARAAASLDHPNICTVHEIDETAVKRRNKRAQGRIQVLEPARHLLLIKKIVHGRHGRLLRPFYIFAESVEQDEPIGEHGVPQLAGR